MYISQSYMNNISYAVIEMLSYGYSVQISIIRKMKVYMIFISLFEVQMY